MAEKKEKSVAFREKTKNLGRQNRLNQTYGNIPFFDSPTLTA